MKLRNPFKKKPVIPEALSKLPPEQLEALVAAFNQMATNVQPEVVGDGKAEFLEPMTESEYATWVHEEEHGFGALYRKLLHRG